MKIKLPVPYQYDVRLLRSKNKTQEEMACAVEEFDIPSYSSQDVHLVAEWHQVWRSEARLSGKGTLLAPTDDWAKDLEADRHVARLVLIDGKFHAPLRVNTMFRSKPLLANELIKLMWDEDLKSQGIFGNHHTMLWNWQAGRRLRESGYEVEGDTAFAAVPEVTRFREIISSSYEAKVVETRDLLKPLKAIDGVIFVEVEEPCIAVHVTSDAITMKIGKRDEDASETTQFFSLADASSADDYFAENRSGKNAIRQVEATRVLISEALQADMEQEEMLRSVQNLIHSFGGHLFDLPKDIASVWYDLRDLHRDCRATDDETLEKLKEAALNLTETINNHPDVSEEIREIGQIGASLAARWELRPVSL
jgi:hypothetical protein